VPTCDKKYCTLAVKEPDDNWWAAMNLDSPAALTKVYVAQSQCFTLVDRGKLCAVKHRAALAGLKGDHSAHSLRSGFMTEAGRQNVPLGSDCADRASQRANCGTILPRGIGGEIPGGNSIGKWASKRGLSIELRHNIRSRRFFR